MNEQETIVSAANKLVAQWNEALNSQAQLERIVDELVDIARADGSMRMGPCDLAGFWRGRCNDLERERRRSGSLDARIAELERSRPVGDWPEARRLREAWASMGQADRQIMLANIEEWDSKELASALRAFCESAPPASIPAREFVVESEAARKLRAAWARATIDDRFFVCDDWMVADDGSTTRRDLGLSFRAFCESAPPTSAPSESDTQRLVQLAEYQDRAMRAEEEVEKLKRELEALRATPPRVEREVDRDLRAALPSHLEWTNPDLYVAGSDRRKAAKAISAWLAAPLSAAPAQDEYTKAAVAYAEAMARTLDGEIGGQTLYPVWGRFRALYDARKRGEASAAKVEPAPAEERVTLYFRQIVNGDVSMTPYLDGEFQQFPLGDGDRWLAIDARVAIGGCARGAWGVSAIKQIGTATVELSYEGRAVDCDTVIARFDLCGDGQWACTSVELLKGAYRICSRDFDEEEARAKRYAEECVAKRDVGVDRG